MFTRRKFLHQSGILTGAGLLVQHFFNKSLAGNIRQQSPLPNAASFGSWQYTPNNLPVYEYTGKLPFVAFDKDGKDALLPADPYFILGNYRCTLFAHASGIVQFLTGERAWARINAADEINYGANNAGISISENNTTRNYDLVGMHSLAADPSVTKRFFGIGYARYQYMLANQVVCTRVLSIKPSAKINDGNAAVVITVSIKNISRKTLAVSYQEKIRMNYVPLALQEQPNSSWPVTYTNQVAGDRKTAVCAFQYKEKEFLAAHKKEESNLYDAAPVSVFMQAEQDAAGTIACNVTGSGPDALCATMTTSLIPGGTKTFNLVVGLNYETDISVINRQVTELFAGADKTLLSEGLFALQWKKKLPDFTSETNSIFRREMLWNTYVLEAMATYSAYFQETYLPQGTVYTYEDGENISNRDHSQAMLPCCYTNPALAKSALRYVLKHSSYLGEIKRGTSGMGYITPSIYKESDEQLYLFMSLSEYLRITKDYGLLHETINYYPMEYSQTATVIELLQKYFIYLRDEVGRGRNGLVKILNSDWSDSFFHKYSPNLYAQFAESLLNTTMALAVLLQLMNELKNAGELKHRSFIMAIQKYYDELSVSFSKDFGNRDFAARCYLNFGKDDKLGMDNVCIEPQGYLLQLPTLNAEKKRAIYNKVKTATCLPEKIGFRTREKPLWGGKGEGEDGGIWFSLEGPMVIGIATFDKEEAWAVLEKMTFYNFSVNYPNYWVGHWTLPDNVNSTLSAREGLYAYWQDTKKAIQGFCSHPHSWPLYCYFKIKE